MVNSTNGRQNGHSPSRVGLDDRASTPAQASAPSARAEAIAPHYSGRTFVVAACAVVLLLWGSLYVVFLEWRVHYRARTDFGVNQVAPVIDSFAGIAPPGVDANAWKEAVRETHAMLDAVLSANLLDVPQMESLREELRQAAEQARLRPENACAELGDVWTTMSDRAGFVLQEGASGRRKAHTRPSILPPGPVRSKGPPPGPNAS